MCIAFWHQWSSPTVSPYRLMVGFNRDENFSRRTTAAHRWASHPDVFAGKDLVGNGTWLGVSKGGRFACITNYRQVHRIYPIVAERALRYTPVALLPLLAIGAFPTAAIVGGAAAFASHRLKRYLSSIPSRGHFVLDFLTTSTSASEFMAGIEGPAGQCTGFNLLVFDTEELWYYSNVTGTPPEPVPAGVTGGLSNSVLHRPWAKVQRGVQLMGPLVGDIQSRRTSDADVIDRLFALLADKERVGGPQPHTGSGWPNWFERRWSSIFCSPTRAPPPYGFYGTRCSTAVLVKWDGTAVFAEREFDANGTPRTAQHTLPHAQS